MLSKIRDKADSPASWLFRTVRHRALNARAQPAARSHYESDYCQQKSWFTSHVQTNIEADEAVAAIAACQMNCERPSLARLWGNLNFEQIGELTSVSIATAQRRYLRGLDLLKKRLDREQLLPWRRTETIMNGDPIERMSNDELTKCIDQLEGKPG